MQKQIALPSTKQPVQPITNEYVQKAISKFKDMDELILDQRFRMELEIILNNVRNRPDAPAGKRYVRGAWEYFNENSLFGVDNFLRTFEQINGRIGVKRPMDVRELVGRIIKDASTQTIVYYAQQEMLVVPARPKRKVKSVKAVE